jgi:DMSO/TMAO reductase YedYZ molybdopterin-dependent catalytic subunit
MRRRQFINQMFAAGTLIYFGCDAEDGISMQTPDMGFDGGPDQGMGDPDQGLLDGALADQGLGDHDAGHQPDQGDDPDASVDPDATVDPDMSPNGCADAFAGGEYIEPVGFTGGDPIRFHEPRNQGWDGRLYTDLSLVDADRLATPNDEFYIRTLFPDQLDLDAMMPWQIEVSGLVRNPGPIALADLLDRVEPMGTHVLECSGNGRRSHFGLMSAAAWSGIPIQAVLDRLDRLPEGTRIEISGFDEHSVPSANGHSTPGAAWIFTPEQLIERGAFFATEMNGEVLPLDHGFPVRLYVPGWYGCVCIKWVTGIRVVDEDEPATSQMTEFAQRTHQDGSPRLARNFSAADMHQAAMPIRIERWLVDGRTVFRVVGILWGGFRATEGLHINFGDGPVPVDVCPAMQGNDTWTLWTHAWRPEGPGEYQIHCSIDDDSVPTRRLDTGFYDRFVAV